MVFKDLAKFLATQKKIKTFQFVITEYKYNKYIKRFKDIFKILNLKIILTQIQSFDYAAHDKHLKLK